MKISYFNYHYDIEGTAIGAAAQIRDLATAFGRLGHQVDLQFRTPKPPGAKARPGGLKKIAWLRRHGHVPRVIWRNLRLLREELRLLDAFLPDVLLTVSAFCNFSALYAARRRGVPFVLFTEAPLEYEYSVFFPQYNPYPLLSRWLEGLNLRGAREVVCISEVLKGYMIRYGVPATKLHVIPNGVDHRAFRPQPPDPEIQSRFKLQDRLVVGYIGSFGFFPEAGLFMEIAREVCRRHPQVVFFFVGEGPAADHLRQGSEAAGLGERFLFTGLVPHDQVPRYLSVMDIVLSPYRDDYLFYNSPMKLLEYMAAGKATLNTALGQIKELVADGYNGMLYEPGDYRGFAEKLQQLVADRELRHAMGAIARRTIERNWTWDRQAARLAQVLELARRAG